MRGDVLRLLSAVACTLSSIQAVDLKLPTPAHVFRLKDVVESNPILRRLSMFSDEHEFEDITIDSTTSLPQAPHAPIIVYSEKEKAESSERKMTTSRRKSPIPMRNTIRSEHDNFGEHYRKLNETLFMEAIHPSQELPMRTIPQPGQSTQATTVEQFFNDVPTEATTTLEPFTATMPFSYEDLDANWIDENNSNQPSTTTPTPFPTQAPTSPSIDVTRFPTFANQEVERETYAEPESTTPFEVDESIFSTTAVADYHANNTPEIPWTTTTTPPQLPLETTTLKSIVFPAYTMTAEPPTSPETFTTPSYVDEPVVTHQPANKIEEYDNSIEEPIPAGHLTEVQGYVYRFHDGKTYRVNEDHDQKPNTYERVRAMTDYLIPEPTKQRLEKMKTSTVDYRTSTTSSPMGIFNFDNFHIQDDRKPVVIPYGRAPSIFSIPSPLKQPEMMAIEMHHNEVNESEKPKEPMVKRNNNPLKYYPSYMAASEEEDSSEEYYDTDSPSSVLKENWVPTPEPFPAFSDRCFQNKRKAILVNVTPFERRINISPTNCLIFCSEFKTCRSVVYSSEREICDVYNVKNGHAMAKLVELDGYTYLEVRDKELMADCIQGNPSQNAAKIYHPQETIAAINARKDTLETNHVSTDRQEIEVLAADTSSLDGAGVQ
uniref:Apple domain-containing protein n=1 Tax=Steinernema glaseri TaxID=37863 RepID=A0A1I7YBT6_9BILA